MKIGTRQGTVAVHEDGKNKQQFECLCCTVNSDGLVKMFNFHETKSLQDLESSFKELKKAEPGIHTVVTGIKFCNGFILLQHMYVCICLESNI